MRITLFLLAFFSVSAHAATGEAIYQSKCNSCHDSGAGNAPRITVREDWVEREKRGRAAMHASALKGIPATAMAAKGGYAELTDAEVRATVDYMLKRAGFRDIAPAKEVRLSDVPNPVTATVPDATLVQHAAQALQKALAPGARIDMHDGQATVRGLNVRVAAREGVITLSGAVEKGDLIQRVQAVAQSVAGVRAVVNRVVAAGMLDFD